MFNSKKTIKNDAILRILLINGIVLLILATILLYKYGEVAYYLYIYIFGALLLLSLPLRYLIIKNFPINTEIVSGKVIKSRYYRGSRIIRYEYSFEGVLYKSTAWTNYTSDTQNMEKDTLVDVMLKARHPRKSMLADLFYDR